jgi:hypothetical protein
VKRKLELEHPHLRDDRVVFLEDLHLYVIDNNIDELPISGTAFKAEFFPKFNAEKTFLYSKKYIGCDKEKTKIAWSANGKQAADRGKYIHLQIELYLNSQPCDMEAREMQLFLRWFRERPNWMPIRTEMSLFVKNVQLAGQFDALFSCDGRWILVDWKISLIKRTGFCWCFRKEEIKMPNSDHAEACGRFGSHPLTAHLESCDLNQYFLQLNIYRYMLKVCYNMTVNLMYLVALKSELAEAETIQAPIWEELVENMVRHRAESIGVAFDVSD